MQRYARVSYRGARRVCSSGLLKVHRNFQTEKLRQIRRKGARQGVASFFLYGGFLSSMAAEDRVDVDLSGELERRKRDRATMSTQEVWVQVLC